MNPTPVSTLDSTTAQALFNGTLVGMLLVSKRGRILSANRAICRWLGYSQKVLKTKTIRDITHPDDWPDSLRVFKGLWSRGRNIQGLEKRYLHKNGQTVWGQVAACRVRHSNGRSDFSAAQIVDITARKRMEDALRISETHFQMALARSPTTVFSHDRALRYTWVYNPSPGFRSADVLGKQDRDFLDARDARPLMAFKRRVIKSGVPQRAELITHNPESAHAFDVSLAPLRDRKGRVTGITGMAFDITERKQREALLRRQAQILAQVSDAIVATDLNGHITEWNRGAEQIFGYTAPDVVGRHIRILYPKSLHEMLQNQIIRSVKARGRFRGEVWTRHRNRQPILADLSVSLLRDERGQACGMIGYCRDATRRKRAEEALLEANRELETKVKERTAELRALAVRLINAEDAERKRIVDILHEDLQQILVALRYEIETLRDADTPEAKKSVSVEAQAILDKALQVTRTLSADLRPPGLQLLSFTEKLALVADEMKIRFGLAVRLAVAPDAEPRQGELRSLIIEAIRELLFNVVKHAGTKDVELRVKSSGTRLKVEVQDWGKGYGSLRKSREGLGLLKIRERAEHVGGEFHVVSRPGGGTCATLWVPRLV